MGFVNIFTSWRGASCGSSVCGSLRRLSLATTALVGFVAAGSLPAFAGQLVAADFTTYDASNASSIAAGPFSLYAVSLNSLLPTQMNEGYVEVSKKATGFDLIGSASALQANLLTAIEPVVIGPGGKLYLTDGHHTLTALSESSWGASNPTVYVNVIANYSNLTTAQFWQTMQANNMVLPVNQGVAQTLNTSTGSPIASSLTGLANDPYRGLEYSILKNKSSKLFTTANNLTGAVGASTAGLDKITGLYSDFLEAAAYRSANNGLGLATLTPSDVALATQWNLTGTNTTSLPGVGTVSVAQLPGYILSNNITITGTISNATLANGALDGTKTGTFDQVTNSASFNGISSLTLGSTTIGTPNKGFIMELGADSKHTVTLTGNNSYTGGTTIIAGTLNVNSDAALGAAAPTSYTLDSNNIKKSVQDNNGIIFNSLTEGAGTLQLGGSFATNRAIAVDGEVATIDLNSYTLTYTGQLISLGTVGVGIGNATGISDLTITDSSKVGGGVFVLGGNAAYSNPNFYGNTILSGGTLEVWSDAGMGNTTGPAVSIGTLDLDGGTFKAMASFNSVRNVITTSKNSFDINGQTVNFAGTLSDTQRLQKFINSSSAAGSVSFGSLVAGAGVEVQVGGNGTGASGNTTVDFVNGIQRVDHAVVMLGAGTGATLGSSAIIKSSGTAPTLTNGIIAPWTIIDNSSASSNPYDFATYDATKGYIAATYSSTNIATAKATDVVKQSGNTTLSKNAQAYALNVQKSATIALGNNTLTLGNGSGAAGLILNGGNVATLSGGTLNFGAAEGVVDVSGTNTITSTIAGSGGLTLTGTGTLNINTASTETGQITLNAGTLNLGAQNVFAASTSGLYLADTKNLSSAVTATVNITANNQFAALNSAGSNSSINLSNGAALTIGDGNNLSSTLSSTITETGTAVAGAITKNGSGLLDLSGSKFTLVSGSTVAVNDGQLRVAASSFVNPTNVSTAVGTEVQFAGNGGGIYSGNISGGGALHLIGGTLELAGTSNSYSGGTVLESGSTLVLTTANVSSGNANISNAGGLVDFDQTTNGSYNGIVSDGVGMGTSTVQQGSLVKDDSTGASAGNVTLTQAQTYSGNTTIEAGTLTLGAQNAVANSALVDLGRVGGTAGTATLALGANQLVQSLTSEAGNSTFVTLGGNTLTIGSTGSASNANANSSFGGVISGTGQVVKQGTGTLTLSGANSYSGGTSVTAGTLALASGGSITGPLTNAANVAIASGGMVALTGTSSNSGTIAVASGGTLSNAGGLTNSGTLNVAGTVSGAGSLVQTGGTTNVAGSLTQGSLTIAGGSFNQTAGTTTITGNTSNAGTVGVSGGTFNTAGTFDNSGAVSVTNGATLNAGVYNNKVGGTTSVVNGTLDPVSINVSGGSFVANGAILDGSVSVTGGQFEVGANGATISGAYQQTGGVLDIDATIGSNGLLTGALLAKSVSISGNSALDFSVTGANASSLSALGASLEGKSVSSLFQTSGTVSGNFQSVLLTTYASVDGQASKLTEALLITNGVVTGEKTISVSAVPLPGAAMMFGSGLMGLVAWARRQRNKAKRGRH